jgi:hypothetical protein
MPAKPAAATSILRRSPGRKRLTRKRTGKTIKKQTGRYRNKVFSMIEEKSKSVARGKNFDSQMISAY